MGTREGLGVEYKFDSSLQYKVNLYEIGVF